MSKRILFQFFVGIIISIIIFSCDKNDSEPDTIVLKPDANGHEYVDLGLPSENLWATCNVGAAEPHEYGKYYMWGEVHDQKELDPEPSYSWLYYTLWDIERGEPTRYCSSSLYDSAYVDNLTTLFIADDAAHTNMGGDWRIPTHTDFEELIEYCTWKYEIRNLVKGYVVESKKNGTSIFLPFAGYRELYNYHNEVGEVGRYWSSVVFDNRNAYYLQINPNGSNQSTSSAIYVHEQGIRCFGFNVRGVLSSTTK